MITQENFKNLFSYKDGDLYWKSKPSKTSPIKIGSKVGTLMSDGYLKTHIYKKIMPLHRIIFLMHNGFLPEIVDHIDGNRLNNKIENLRKATKNENRFNSKLNKNNKSGIKGIHFNNKSKKWIAQLCVNYKIINLGSYENLELAELVIQEARIAKHGVFARHI